MVSVKTAHHLAELKLTIHLNVKHMHVLQEKNSFKMVLVSCKIALIVRRNRRMVPSVFHVLNMREPRTVACHVALIFVIQDKNF